MYIRVNDILVILFVKYSGNEGVSAVIQSSPPCKIVMRTYLTELKCIDSLILQ